MSRAIPHRFRRVRRLAITSVVLTLTQTLVFAPVARAQWYNPVDWVTSGVGAVVEKVADAVFSGVLKFIAELIAKAVTSATELLISVFDNITVGVDATGKMTGPRTSALQVEFIALGAGLVTLLFFVRIIGALASNQMGRVVREIFFDLPFTVIGTVAAGFVGYLILEFSDQLSSALTADFATDLGTFSGKFFIADALVSGGLFSFIFAILYILGAIALGAQLVVRAALLEIIFIVAPTMIATRTWQGSRRYSRRFIEIAIGLMFGKPAAALCLAVGAANLADGDGVVGLLKGVVLVLLGAFMPFSVFKLIPVVEGAASQQGIAGAPVRAAQSAIQTVGSLALIGTGAGAIAAGAAKGSASGGGGGASNPGTSPSGPATPSGDRGSGGNSGGGAVSSVSGAAPLRSQSAGSESVPDAAVTTESGGSQSVRTEESATGSGSRQRVGASNASPRQQKGRSLQTAGSVVRSMRTVRADELFHLDNDDEGAFR